MTDTLLAKINTLITQGVAYESIIDSYGNNKELLSFFKMVYEVFDKSFDLKNEDYINSIDAAIKLIELPIQFMILTFNEGNNSYELTFNIDSSFRMIYNRKDGYLKVEGKTISLALCKAALKLALESLRFKLFSLISN